MKLKTKLFFALLCIIVLPVSADAQTLFVDDFNYGPVSTLAGVNGWSQSGVSSVNKVTVISPGLTFPGYEGSGSGNTVFMNNIDGEIVLHNFTTVNSGTVYYSCMINADSMSLNAYGGYNIALDQSGGATNITAGLSMTKLTSTTFKFGLRKTSTNSYANGIYNTNTTYVAVIKYVFMPGPTNNDSLLLYIFDSAVPATEPSVPTLATTNGNDNIDVGQVVLSNSYAQGGMLGSSVKVDGIRVGLSWQSTIITELKTVSTEVPEHYALEQNYPNPFNPSTTIRFSIPHPGQARLTIYNGLGQIVSLPVNEFLISGSYEVQFPASGLASGVYYYNLTTGGFSETRKMMLVK